MGCFLCSWHCSKYLDPLVCSSLGRQAKLTGSILQMGKLRCHKIMPFLRRHTASKLQAANSFLPARTERDYKPQTGKILDQWPLALASCMALPEVSTASLWIDSRGGETKEAVGGFRFHRPQGPATLWLCLAVIFVGLGKPVLRGGS